MVKVGERWGNVGLTSKSDPYLVMASSSDKPIAPYSSGVNTVVGIKS